jgi:competence protein ComGC
LDYGTPKTSGMARTAMILGIVGLLTAILGIGILLGIVALILGIVSLTTIAKNPQLTGKGFATTGIVTGGLCILVAPVLLLIAILVPSLGKARELSNRSVCAANLRGIAQSVNIYAADNNDAYPIIARPGGYGLAAAGSGVPQSNSDATLSSIYNAPSSPSIPQNMWILVLTGQVAPKQFICKSDPATTTPAMTNLGAGYLTNFNDGKGPSDFAYSYSFAYPWTAAATPASPGSPAIPAGSVGRWWKNETDASLPLMADMAPLEGTGSPAATPGTGMSKSANSFNHNRDGQNVAYGDAHAEFARNTAVGQANDNIFAASHGTPNPTGRQTAGIIPDIAAGGSMGAWDICLVPAADANHAYQRK